MSEPDDPVRELAEALADLHGYELPIVDELGERLERQMRVRARPERRAAPQLRRGRRIAFTTAALLVVGTTAIAARTLTGDRRDDPIAPSTLIRGTASGAGYVLRGYRDADRACLALRTGGELASRCGATPGSTGAEILSAAGPSDRFVAGVTGRRVASVEISLGGAPPRRLRTRTLPPGVFASGLRAFVLVVPRSRREPPARVRLLDRRGRALATVVDCTLGVGLPGCRTP